MQAFLGVSEALRCVAWGQRWFSVFGGSQVSNMGFEGVLGGFRRHFMNLQRIFGGFQMRYAGVFGGYGGSQVRYIWREDFLMGAPNISP